jgi:hypothetical protein
MSEKDRHVGEPSARPTDPRADRERVRTMMRGLGAVAARMWLAGEFDESAREASRDEGEHGKGGRRRSGVSRAR